MLSDLFRSFGQLSDPAARRVVWKALIVTLIAFLLVWIAAGFGIDWLRDWASQREDAQGLSALLLSVLEILFTAAAFASVLVASFLLFPAVVPLAMSFLLEDICRAVEARYYPELPAPRAQPIAEMLGDALRLALVTIGLNLLLLPLYLALFFIPPLNLFVFYGLNGYLLGREFFEMAAARRIDSRQARRLRKRYRGRVLLAGAIIAVLLSVPLLGLIMPVVAIAFMLHVFEDMRERDWTAASG